MIIFGTRSSTLGTFETRATNCSCCGNQTIKRVAVFGSYFHVFWVPTFPLGKTIVMECTHCLKTSRKSEFSPEQNEQYEQQKDTIQRPLWHWSGLIVFGILYFALNVAAFFR